MIRANRQPDDMFTAAEIAEAAGVPVGDVRALLRSGQALAYRDFVARPDAVRIVRALRGSSRTRARLRPPLTLAAEPRRRGTISLVASGSLHAAFFALMLAGAWLGLLQAADTEQTVKDDSKTQLVYLMLPGPGGGGGGGGVHVPDPPPPAERKAIVPKKPASPVPPIRRPPPPAPITPPPPPKVDPPKPPPLPAVQAPVVPVPADPVDKIGLLDQIPSPAKTAGSGAGGGVGTGAGTGLGDGDGSGIGPGSGGGTGGGPFQPGAGIDPPSVLREVRPLYTDEARRRSIEGSVLLEIIVRRDGSVGDVHVMRTLPAGLEQRAIDAVRQWRFRPARRQGSPVDVVAQVSVDFKLR